VGARRGAREGLIAPHPQRGHGQGAGLPGPAPLCYTCHPVLKLIIEDDEGRKTVVPFVREELTIGRQEGNSIRLTERNVSRRHARLLRQDAQVLVEDLGSYNGVRLNGERVEGQVPVRHGDLLQIGDYDLALQQEGAVHATAAARGSAGSESEPGSDARHHATAIIRRDQVEAARPRPVEALEPALAPPPPGRGG